MKMGAHIRINGKEAIIRKEYPNGRDHGAGEETARRSCSGYRGLMRAGNDYIYWRTGIYRPGGMRGYQPGDLKKKLGGNIHSREQIDLYALKNTRANGGKQ